MSLPDLTALQFAILNVLGGNKKAGREIREQLAMDGIRKSGPAFYQLMSRLEDAGFVKGWYDKKIVKGQLIKERFYQITADGLRSLNDTRRFFAVGTAESKRDTMRYL